MDRAHFVPQSAIKKEFPHGLMRRVSDGLLCAQGRKEDFVSGGVPWEPVPLDLILWDTRCWTPMCRRHHADFDNYRFRITRSELPAMVEEFAAEYGLMYRLDSLFGVNEHVRDAEQRFLAS